ncbi:Hypothetical protein, conserved [Brucella abortus str. 2308 A]|uniref:Uncharacterized protein n=1 Tax=Brucella ceti str. Cudo TaxID=595497 RepID=C0G917_9HYPH|nr:conserved hypothetical protein [Brucella melitensis M28]ADZ88177.1 conserved hypothetical protein [Brucella melitensis M5-90]AEW15896.1 hypothetical protein BCA52141_II1152 [Brucella canis HSK A52141]AEW18746.1 hypothetical protein BAA13334_II00299 [Brucella abortus A13334]AIB18720.1 Hypothetical protein BSSP3_II0026 [Brucella suis bv. 2]EEH13431.1 Hypothetical protein, conserved [Brucella ceti str. Cudo]EEP61608.1 Hypothetical protein, conserved [Brucella abortus str. 2308 A]
MVACAVGSCGKTCKRSSSCAAGLFIGMRWRPLTVGGFGGLEQAARETAHATITNVRIV